MDLDETAHKMAHNEPSHLDQIQLLLCLAL